MKYKWGGVRKESEVIKEIHDQWCTDNGYRIRERVIQYGKLSARYGHKSGQNVAKKRRLTATVYAAEKK